MIEDKTSEFGRSVLDACAAIKAAGPLVAVAPADPVKEPGKRAAGQTAAQLLAAAQDRLMAAALRGDLDAAKAEVAAGADPRGNFKGAVGLFEQWVGGRVASAKSSGKGEEGSAASPSEWESAKAMLLWLDSQGVALSMGMRGSDAKETARARGLKGATAKGLGQARRREMEDILVSAPQSGGSQLSVAIAALAESWGMDARKDARVGPQDWIEKIYAPSNGELLGCESLAIELGKVGGIMERRHWEELAERMVFYAEDMAPAGMIQLIEAQPSSAGMGDHAMGMLMAHAIGHDSLVELGALAARCPKPMWRLPASLWEEMCCGEPEGKEGPTLVEYAVNMACNEGNKRELARTGEAKGMDCLRALARLPGAVEEAKFPHPGIFEAASIEQVALVGRLIPQLLEPNRKGDTFAHHWACASWGSGPVGVIALLKSELAPWALRTNKNGESAISVLKASQHASRATKAKADKAFVAYETKAVRAEVGRAPRKKPGAKAKRL